MIIIYLELLIERTAENLHMFCDTVILLVEEPGFVTTLKKSVMTPSQEIEFLGVVLNSKEMTISFPEQKLQKVKLQCLDLYQSTKLSTVQLTKVCDRTSYVINPSCP